jgi:hypothetical protein
MHDINFLIQTSAILHRLFSRMEKIYRALSTGSIYKQRVTIQATSYLPRFLLDSHFKVLILSCCT